MTNLQSEFLPIINEVNNQIIYLLSSSCLSNWFTF